MTAPTLYRDTDSLRLYVDHRYTDRALLVPGLTAAKDEQGMDYFRAALAWTTMVAIGAEFGSLPGFQADPSLDTAINFFLQQEAYAAAVKAGTTGFRDDGRLFEYQHQGVDWLANMERVALCDEMGTGKTVMALRALSRMDAYPALVVAPTSMTHVWAAEAKVWAPEAEVFVLEGTAPKREKIIQAACDRIGEGHPQVIVVVGWGLIAKVSKLAWYGGAKALTAAEKSDGILQRIDWLTVIADEAHRMKDPKAKRTMAVKGAARPARWRWALTGTPLSNQPGDVWSILHFLEPAEWPSRSKFYDRWVYSVETQWGHRPVAWRQDSRAEIDRHLHTYILRRTKAEVLPDLPEKTYQIREVEMTSKQATLYRKMVKDMIAEVDGEILAATDPLALLTRLSQVASAMPVIEDDEVTALERPSNKVDALLDILEEVGHDRQVVVFAESRKLLELAAREILKAGHSYVEITGTIPAEIRAGNIERFQAGNAQVALVSLGAGAEGITLTAADTAVFLQRSYSMVKNLQAEDRIHRAGQQSDKVLIIDVVSPGTVDVAAARAAARKQELLIDTLRDRERLAAIMKGAE